MGLYIYVICVHPWTWDRSVSGFWGLKNLKASLLEYGLSKIIEWDCIGLSTHFLNQSLHCTSMRRLLCSRQFPQTIALTRDGLRHKLSKSLWPCERKELWGLAFHLALTWKLLRSTQVVCLKQDWNLRLSQIVMFMFSPTQNFSLATLMFTLHCP